jgi:hypothetical protein
MEHSHFSRTNKPCTAEEYLDIFRDQLLSGTLKYSWNFPLESNLSTACNKKNTITPYNITRDIQHFPKKLNILRRFVVLPQ